MHPFVDALCAHPNPSQPAVDDSHRSLSYAELGQQVAELAFWLRANDCRVIGLLADNSIDWIVADLAALEAGRTLVPLPQFFSAAQREHVVATCGIDTLLVDSPAVGAHMAPLGFLPDPDDIGGLSVFRRHTETRADEHFESSPAKITFTSGSTGQPKGVCLSAATIAEVVARLHEVTSEIDAKRHLCVMPLATLLENIAGVYVPLLRGATVQVRPLASLGLYGSSRLDATRLRHTLESLAPQSLIVQPEVLRALTASYEAIGDRNHDLEFVAVGGARVTDDDIDAAIAAGIPAYQGYGLSECASVVALNRPGDARRGSVGRPLPGVSVSIAADGEIIVGHQGMLGYLGEPAGNDIVRTGDLGYLDDDGFLYVTGRAKNVFITSFGRNVSPEWPEAELLHEEAIAHACVFGEGMPCNTAVVVPADDRTSKDALTAAIRSANSRLPDYARIAYWIGAPAGFSVENGLLTTTGKPRREAVQLQFLLSDDTVPYERPPALGDRPLNSNRERTLNETF